MQKPSNLFAMILILFLVFSVLSTIMVVPTHATGITNVGTYARGWSTNNATVLATLNAAPTSGNVLVAVIGTMCYISQKRVSSISETSVTWSYQANRSVLQSGVQFDVDIWLGVVSADASASITITLSGTPYYGAIADIYEYSGVATSSALDQTAYNNSYSATPDTGTTSTTTQATELWIGGIILNANNQSAPTNGFTLTDGIKYTSMSLAYLEKNVSSTGTANSGTTPTASNAWAGCIATFKAGADTTPPTFGAITANTTIAGNAVRLSCTASDDVAVSGGYATTNNTGSDVNQTWTASSGAMTYDLTWDSTVGNIIAVYWTANDTSNNIGYSATTYFTLTAASSGWSKDFCGVPNSKIGSVGGVPISKIGSVGGVP